MNEDRYRYRVKELKYPSASRSYHSIGTLTQATQHTGVNRVKTIAIRWAFLLTAVTALPACAPLLVTGAIGGSAMVVTDRRGAGIQLEDQTIEIKAARQIRESISQSDDISVTSFNRHVLLTGVVNHAKDRDKAAQVVAQVDNVGKILNQLEIGPSPTLTERSTDALITAKIKAQLIDRQDILGNNLKIVTERAVVYLMGRVTQAEAHRATEVAQQVSGVKKVVRNFEILSEAEYKALSPDNAPRK